MRRVLFVCTGNLARSPVAERLLQAKLAGMGVDGVEVSSAGVMADEGNPPAGLAALEMAARGLNLNGHRSRPLTPSLAREADHIIVMEMMQYRVAAAMANGAADKVRLLGEFLPGGGEREIPDPYGGEREDMRATLEMIDRAVAEMAMRLRDGTL